MQRIIHASKKFQHKNCCEKGILQKGMVTFVPMPFQVFVIQVNYIEIFLIISLTYARGMALTRQNGTYNTKLVFARNKEKGMSFKSFITSYIFILFFIKLNL